MPTPASSTGFRFAKYFEYSFASCRGGEASLLSLLFSDPQVGGSQVYLNDKNDNCTPVRDRTRLEDYISSKLPRRMDHCAQGSELRGLQNFGRKASCVHILGLFERNLARMRVFCVQGFELRVEG